MSHVVGRSGLNASDLKHRYSPPSTHYSPMKLPSRLDLVAISICEHPIRFDGIVDPARAAAGARGVHRRCAC